jgi:acyl-CoA synthetase (AMP-forming)/AMP-acid ligase II
LRRRRHRRRCCIVEILEAIPKAPSDKILRRQLIERDRTATNAS